MTTAAGALVWLVRLPVERTSQIGLLLVFALLALVLAGQVHDAGAARARGPGPRLRRPWALLSAGREQRLLLWVATVLLAAVMVATVVARFLRLT